jgi:protocatechuate 3,4-dioxygenase beta subunit
MTACRERNAPAGRVAAALIVLVALVVVAAVLILAQRELATQAPVAAPIAASPSRITQAAPSLPAPEAADPSSLTPSEAAATASATRPEAPYIPEDAGPRPDHVDVLVVDSEGDPVEGAEVLVRESPKLPPPGTITAELSRLRTESTHDGVLDAEELKRKSTEWLKAHVSGPSPSTWESPSARYVTDERGACRVLLAGGDAELLAQKPELGTSGTWSVSTFERRSGTSGTSVRDMQRSFRTNATLTLRKQATIEGVVQDRLGRSLAGALVGPGSMPSSIGRDDDTRARPPAAMSTDSEGRFHMAIDTPCRVELKAKADGVESPGFEVWLLPGQTVSAVLRFAGSFSVSGHVLDKDGKPVEAATVTASGDLRVNPQPARSAADGSFQVDLSEAGEISLTVSKDGLIQDRPATVTLTDTAPRGIADLVLVPCSRIEGLVRWATGEPIPQCMVNAEPQLEDVGEGNDFMASQFERADADGHFVLDMIHPDQLYVVEAFLSITATADVRDVKAGTKDVVLVVDRETAEGVAIELTVVDADSGAAVPHYKVRHDFWINGLHEDAKGADVDDPSGRFVLDHCKPGSDYGFVVAADGYGRLQIGPVIPTEAGAAITARLGRTGNIRVAVVDGVGAPVPGAKVLLAEALSEISDRFDYFRTGTTDATGVATFADEPPGRYAVLARHPPGVSDLVRVDLLSGRTADARAVVDEQTSSGELVVRVRDADGKPIAGVEVMPSYLTDIDANGEWTDNEQEDPNGVTGGDGQFLLTSLAPGLYWVYVQSEETRFIAPLQAQVFSGKRAVLEFTATTKER